MVEEEDAVVVVVEDDEVLVDFSFKIKFKRGTCFACVSFNEKVNGVKV